MKNRPFRMLIVTIITLMATDVLGDTESFLGKGEVSAIQFSPDGQWLAIGTSAVLELYSTKTYQPVYTIEADVQAIDFSPDSKNIVVADNQVLRLIETATGRVEILETYEKPISDVAYSPNGEGIASIDIQGVLRLWRRKEAAVTVRDASNRKADFSLLFSPDGNQIIVGASNVEVWESDDAQLVGEWRTNSHVTALALHPAGDQLVAVGTEDGEIELWSLERGERVGVIDGKDIKTDSPRSNVTVESLAFGRDGAILIAGFQDAVIAVWDTENHTLLRSWITKTEPDAEFKGWGVSGISPNYEIRRWPALLALSPDDQTVAVLADRYTKVGYWNVETGKLIGKLDGYSTYRRMLGFSADGTRFATLSSSVQVWDTATKQIIAEMQYDNGGSSAALSPNGNYVAITHRDRRITVWDVNTATVKHVLRGGLWGGTWYWTVAFSPDSRFVAAVALSPIIRVWEVETGKLIAELHHWGDSLDFGSVHFSPDGKWLAAGGGGGIAIWETRGFTVHRIIRETQKLHGGSLTFSPDSQWLVGYPGVPPDKTLFWNIKTGAVDLELPTGIVSSAEFSPDGRWLATAKWGTEAEGYEYAPTMMFWDVETGRLILDLPRSPYLHAIFSPDGQSVALSHDDGRIHLLPIETILPQAVSVEPRGLKLSILGTIKRDALLQNYPNPFNPETWIPYQLAKGSSPKLHITDLMGRHVRTLTLGYQKAGIYLDRARAAYWDGRDAHGQQVASGSYFYQLKTDDFSDVKRMLIVK